MRLDSFIEERESISDTYKRLKYVKNLDEQKKDDNVNIIVLTNRQDENADNKLFRTAKKIKEICDSKKINCYILFTENAHIIRHDDGHRTVHNIGDDKGFEINSDNTVAIIRGSVSRQMSTLDLITQLEKAGIFCINSRNTIETCSDKYRTTLKLADSSIPSPKTSIIQDMDTLEYSFDVIGSKFPVILKTITGSKGVGVFYAESWKSLKSVLQAIWKINEDEELLLQQYIESPYDLRVHVLGGEVIASMKRHVLHNDFRSNFSLGSKVEKVKLSKEQIEIAIRSSKVVGSVWSGVDMMIDKKDNIYVIEINSSPGTEGIEKATGKNVVSMIIDYAINKDNWIKTAFECGFKETVEIKGIGDRIAKFDTGNGSLCVLHTDEYNIDKDKKIVTWGNGDKKFKHEYKNIKNVHVGGLRNYKEDRPVIELDVLFDGVIYKDIDFTLDNRKGRTEVLLNRRFMRKACVMVNPAKVFVLTTKPEEKQ